MTDHATRHEARHFKDLSEILDKPLLLNLVVSIDTEIQQLSEAGVPTYNISAIQLFS